MKFPLFNSTSSLFASRVMVMIAILTLVTASFAQKSRTGTARAPEASVTPIEMQGNPDCKELNFMGPVFPEISSDFEFKIDTPFAHGGPWPFQEVGNRKLVGPTDLANFLTTSGTNFTLNFTSTKMISAVIIKAGATANVYYYENGIFADTNLVVPGQNEISHATFCYVQPATVTIIKSVTTFGPPPNNTSSTALFGFSSTWLSSPTFSLTDQNMIGPDRYSQSNIYRFAPNTITVTEDPTSPNWTLASISCVETAGGGMENLQDTTTNFPAGRTATIRLQQGENVTCTFHNTQLSPSAAPASVSGRVTDSFGNGIGGARLIVTDAQSGDTWTTISSPFGYYSIEGPEAGNFYLMTISHKRYGFADDTRSFTLNEDLVGMDFVANP